MEYNLFDIVIDEFIKRKRHLQYYVNRHSGILFLQIMTDYYKRVITSKVRGKKLAWIGLFAPVELFYALDIVPFIPEYFAMTVVSLMDCKEYYDEAAGYGLPGEVCSLHRLLMGLVLKNALPPPDLVVSTSQTCDTTIKSFEAISNFYRCPSFFLDFPYLDTDKALQYYKEEIGELVEFLETQTERKLDFQELKQVLELSRQVEESFLAIDELKKSVPAPMGLRDAMRHFGVRLVMAGTKEAVAYFQTVRDECSSFVQTKRGVVPQERLRLLWLYVPILFGRLYEWMQREYGAVVVMDSMNYVSTQMFDPSKPLEFLTGKAYNQFLTAHYCRPIEKFTSDITKMVRDYKVDGCIYQAHIGCKHGCATTRILKDVLQEETEAPFFILDGDAMDSSVVSVWEMKNKLEGFLEMLEER